jgi:hypothetical protein
MWDIAEARDGSSRPRLRYAVPDAPAVFDAEAGCELVPLAQALDDIRYLAASRSPFLADAVRYGDGRTVSTWFTDRIADRMPRSAHAFQICD